MSDSTNGATSALGLLPVHCDRRRKFINLKMPVGDMTAALEGIEKRKRNGEALLASLSQIPAGQTPDLIVVFKGEAYVLPTIPDDAKQDLAIRRALNVACGADEAHTFYDVPATTARGPKSDSNGASNGASEEAAQ